MAVAGGYMSIMEQIMQNSLCCFLISLLGLVAIPALFIVPGVILLLVWEAIGLIDDPLYRDLTYAAYINFCVLIFIVKTTNINWFRKHIWRLPPKEE